MKTSQEIQKETDTTLPTVEKEEVSESPARNTKEYSWLKGL